MQLDARQAGGTNVLSPASAVSVAAAGALDLAGYDQTLPSLANAGTVALAGTNAGTTLAVTGDYQGEGGTLVLGTALAGSASPTDRLAVAGDVSGTTTLAIVDLGGKWAQTTGDGIELRQCRRRFALERLLGRPHHCRRL